MNVPFSSGGKYAGYLKNRLSFLYDFFLNSVLISDELESVSVSRTQIPDIVSATDGENGVSS